MGPGEDLTDPPGAGRGRAAGDPAGVPLFRLGFSVLSQGVGAPDGVFAPLLVLEAELGLLAGAGAGAAARGPA
ncbi:MAG: hypothetical protein JNK88_04265 [Mangrovicoccus sp.]|nr:hypothetical protein [Mangrovicoccus sp.]